MQPTAIIVDDSPIIRAKLKSLLQQVGVNVVAEGATGEDATALYARHQPALLFLDIIMPRKDGVTAAGEILASHPAARIVMCTSLSARDKVLACRQMGVTSFILKPFDEAKTKALVSAILSRGSRELEAVQ